MIGKFLPLAFRRRRHCKDEPTPIIRETAARSFVYMSTVGENVIYYKLEWSLIVVVLSRPTVSRHSASLFTIRMPRHILLAGGGG